MAECMEGGGSYGLFHHQLLHEWPQSRHQTYVIPHGHVCQQLNVEALSDHRGKRDKRPCLVREPIKAGENGFTDTTRHMQFRHGTATKTPTCSVLKDIAAGDQRLEELFYEKGIPFSTLVESRDEVRGGATRVKDRLDHGRNSFSIQSLNADLACKVLLFQPSEPADQCLGGFVEPVAQNEQDAHIAYPPGKEVEQRTTTGIRPMQIFHHKEDRVGGRRTAEMTALQECIQQTASGRGGVVQLSGEAGIGKSRLVAELQRSAEALEFQLLSGQCFPADRSCPYAPLLDLLRAFLASLSSTEIATVLGSSARTLFPLLPEQVQHLPEIMSLPPLSSLGPEQEKRRLFATLADVLTKQASSQPVLLVVVD